MNSHTLNNNDNKENKNNTDNFTYDYYLNF